MVTRKRKYADVSTSTLRASLRVLEVPGVRWIFSEQVAGIHEELLHRELPEIAEESGGWLVVAPGGTH